MSTENVNTAADRHTAEREFEESIARVLEAIARLDEPAWSALEAFHSNPKALVVLVQLSRLSDAQKRVLRTVLALPITDEETRQDKIALNRLVRLGLLPASE